MKYWEEMYGKRPKDFIDGVIAGVEACAIPEDGKWFVGILKKPLKDVVAEIKEQLG